MLAQVVYDYEFWMTADPETRARMARAFRMPDVSIATSSAVATMLRDAGRRPDAIVPCAIDHDAFSLEHDSRRPTADDRTDRPAGELQAD